MFGLMTVASHEEALEIWRTSASAMIAKLTAERDRYKTDNKALQTELNAAYEDIGKLVQPRLANGRFDRKDR